MKQLLIIITVLSFFAFFAVEKKSGNSQPEIDTGEFCDGCPD